MLTTFSDWFLPSKSELELIYLNGVINLSEGEFYWSSSEYDENFVWALNGSTGVFELREKFYSGKVIAIRYF